MNLAKGVFVHRADSKYDDFPEERYQFPKRYLNRAMNFVGDWIVYYEPRRGGGQMAYSSIAKIQVIYEDESAEDMFIAEMAPNSFIPFEEKVSYKKPDGFMESDLKKPDGSLNRGLNQWAVRPISDTDFNEIVLKGFPEENGVLPRFEEQTDTDENPHNKSPQLMEEAIEFIFDDERSRVEQTISKIPRSRVFRKKVLDAYDSRCAFTGLKLINGGGRAEVEAAHIKPVEHHGPDTIRNGLALSGTVHWMFDRGLISLTDELDILVSRQANDPDQIWSMVHKDKKATSPENPAYRPHPQYLVWHRQNCFKA